MSLSLSTEWGWRKECRCHVRLKSAGFELPNELDWRLFSISFGDLVSSAVKVAKLTI
jgi:hypothetical protein